ncbi:MAG: 3-phosphoglycerate dehydrogenase [Acidocella sp. 20-57-95]|nr:MAG: 3-phosphoglycerate dehydrogenase [Acidocella sp. 20-57-95]OYV58027.1 MAG: 3-phosphoglycerate dehydrogenase [Acidocella sp. 21-58-7]HQT64532.1 hydroxyacid dehydrogenase [Acidocella sp.]HQU04335.1 hydroxyacid dehydrogenase [Acidocella sp.]
MADIVIAEFMDETSVHQLQAKTPVLYAPDLVDRPDDLRAALGAARALIVRNRTQVRAALLEAGPKLQLIGRLGVGLDNIDLEACAARNIAVYPATGANDAAVAEYVVCTAMMLLRGAYRESAAVAAGSWPRERLIGLEIAGKRAGLVGFGGTARQAATRLAALGMTICAADPFLPASHPAWQTAARLGLNELFVTCDVISLHVPLSTETRHLVNRDTLALMKPSAVLINAARGGVVDEAALADALRAGKIAGAALDVFEREPLDAAHGALLEGIKQLLLTPHIAGVTAESNVRVSGMIADIVLRDLKLG